MLNGTSAPRTDRALRILYFVQYFNLPDEPGGSRPYQFARAWTDAGHQVTVVTGAVNHKTLTVPERYRGRLFVREDVEGIDILRCWSYAGIRGSFKKRMVNFLSFAGTAGLAGILRGRRPQIIYASSTPLTVGLPGLLASAWRGAPFFFETRDLWPQSAVVAGVLSPRSRATQAAFRLARVFYRRARKVVAVTQGIAEGLVADGVPREKVLFVPNGVDDWMTRELDPPPAADSGRFKVVYVGAHGHWNGLGQILDAAVLLRERDDIEFEFIGDGDERAAMMARAAREGLTRVQFLGAVPKQVAFEKLRQGGASIVVTWAHEFQKMVLANKIFDYLAAARPVIAGAHGEMADLIRQAGAGLVVPPENPAALAGAIRELADRPAPERDRLGRSGRDFILRHYQRRDLAQRLLDEFAAAAGGKR